MPPSRARRCSVYSAPSSSYPSPYPTTHPRRAPTHDAHRITITVTITEHDISTATGYWASRDTVPTPTVSSSQEVDCPMSDTPTVEVKETSATALKSGIVGGCVAIFGLCVLATIVYVLHRHRIRQLNALRRCCDVERTPSASSNESSATLITPYALAEETSSHSHSKRSPHPSLPSPALFSPSPSQLYPDVIHIRPLTPPASYATYAPSPLPSPFNPFLSSDARPDPPPTYSSLDFPQPLPPRPPQAPGKARPKTSVSIAQNVRSPMGPAGRRMRPDLRIEIPDRRATWSSRPGGVGISSVSVGTTV